MSTSPIRRARKHVPVAGNTGIVHAKGIEQRYDISPKTRWLWERNGRLPARDVFIGGQRAAWRVETLEAAERGELLVTPAPASSPPPPSRSRSRSPAPPPTRSRSKSRSRSAAAP